MKIFAKRILPFLLCVSLIFTVAGCTNAKEENTSSDNTSSETVSEEEVTYSEAKTLTNENALSQNIKNKVFPMFSNEVNYERGGSTASEEDYPDYKKYIESRHRYEDMVGHNSEVAAVRLAELGVFEKNAKFVQNLDI